MIYNCKQALAYASTNQIAACQCGSFPTLYGDGARPDDGYRSLWCQTCMKHVTGMMPSEREVIDHWNDLREREHAALSQPQETFADEIKRADAAPPESSFDNASDMLGYLNAPQEAEPDDWRDDPSADERWNAGVDLVMKLLCDYLGVGLSEVTWDAATETVDGDISAVIGNILRTKYGENWSPASPSPIPEAPGGRSDAFVQGVREAVIAKCEAIALAIDSGRGNEKEIAKAIRALKPQDGGESGAMTGISSYPETAELLYLADQQAYARNRYNEEDSGLIRESTVIEWALRFAALPSSGVAQPPTETLPTHGGLLTEINRAAHSAGTNAWVRDVLKRAHRAIRDLAPVVSSTEGK